MYSLGNYYPPQMNWRLYLLFLFSCPKLVEASHIRAGEIYYEVIAPFTIKATIVTYAKITGINPGADRDRIPINWGDGTSSIADRVNGPPNVSTGYPHFGEDIGNNIKKNIYEATHVYPGIPPPPNNFFVINAADSLRNNGIDNINNGASDGVIFYVEDTLKFPDDLSNIGFNSSPVLLNPPIDFGNVGDTFYHNPLAYDRDGDSLIYILIPPRQSLGVDVPVYRYPNEIIPGPNNVVSLNRFTGEFIWATPQRAGIYNIAILIFEYRNGVCMGTMVRDMQIIIDNKVNDPPQIVDLNDTCVRAKDLLLITVTASDINVGQSVRLTGNGGPMQLANSPATFPPANGNPVSSIFQWQTLCEHIQKQSYNVVFKAEDNYSTPLVDMETWQIDVIAPPPINLQSTAQRREVTLTWDNYDCSSFTANFRGFSVWRRLGSNPFVPEYCETGLAGKGYTKIADRITSLTYIDRTAIRGNEYCYRILAHFSKKSPNGIYEWDLVESVTSNETCVFLPLDIPLMTKVSVTNTGSTNGVMDLAWTKPKAGGINLDTIQDPPPYKLVLVRSSGFTPATEQEIFTFTRSSYYALNDTTFTDNALNTASTPHNYKVVFFSQNDTIGKSDPASSVFLNITPSDQRLGLNWAFNTPWVNDSFQIFRSDAGSGIYNYITTTVQSSYTDLPLQNDTTYCYYIKSFGHYSNPDIRRPLENLSQIRCDYPRDTIAPCPPILSVTNPCGIENLDTFEFSNFLSWRNQDDSCSQDITGYKIYFQSDSASPLALLQTNNLATDTTYIHNRTNTLAGCYVVTALDRLGNESEKTNRFCIGNCPIYDLPNTFTPNGDGYNDLFTPRKPLRFVSRVELEIFNRWGQKVFETTDPEIKWDGKDQKTGKELPDGVYFYAGYYYEQHLGTETKKPLPYGKGGGFIELLR